MEDNKQFNSNVPVPRIVIDRQGKVMSANENMGEVFLYEGIVGADVFTLTGIKAQDLFEMAVNAQRPLISRNDKIFKILAFDETGSGEDLTIVFLDVTAFEELKDRYNDERPCIAKIQIDNYDEIIEAQAENGGAESTEGPAPQPLCSDPRKKKTEFVF